MAVTVTLSSVGTSNALILNSWAEATTVRVTLGSTTLTTNASIQATIDSSAQTGVSARWYAISTTAVTSANADAGVTYNLTTPVAGLRINSTALSSNTITLTALQSAGG